MYVCMYACMYVCMMSARQEKHRRRGWGGLDWGCWWCTFWSLGQCVTVCCSVLQCVAVCCSVLQCVAVRCSEALLNLHLEDMTRVCVWQAFDSKGEFANDESADDEHWWEGLVACFTCVTRLVHVCDKTRWRWRECFVWCSMLQHAAESCSVLQHAAVSCSVLQRVAACCSMLQHVTVCYSVLHRFAVCFIVLQCVAVWYGFLHTRDTISGLFWRMRPVLYKQCSLRWREAAVASVIIVPSLSVLAPFLDAPKEATHTEAAEKKTPYQDSSCNPQHVGARSCLHCCNKSHLCVHAWERWNKGERKSQ